KEVSNKKSKIQKIKEQKKPISYHDLPNKIHDIVLKYVPSAFLTNTGEKNDIKYYNFNYHHDNENKCPFGCQDHDRVGFSVWLDGNTLKCHCFSDNCVNIIKCAKCKKNKSKKENKKCEECV